MNWQVIKSLPLHLLSTTAIAYIGVVIYLYLRQESLIYLPRRGKIHRTPKEINIPFESHYLNVGEKETIHLWFISSSTQTNTTILFCHGNAGNLEDRLDILQVLYKLGTNIVLFDYRGYGESIGNVSEENTYTDAQLVYEFLRKEKNIPENKIIIFGRSLGGGVACELACRYPGAGALILDSTFFSIPDIAAEYYPYIPARWTVKHRYENSKKIPNITIPKLIIHSKEDEIVPFHHGRRLFEKAAKPKEMLILSCGGHNECFLEDQDRYIQGIKKFLEKFQLI